MSSHQIFTVGNTTPLRITPAGTHSGLDVTIQNVHTTDYVYVGVDNTLTTSNYGYRIMPNHAISFELPGGDDLFIIGSGSSSAAAVIITGLEIGE